MYEDGRDKEGNSIDITRTLHIWENVYLKDTDFKDGRYVKEGSRDMRGLKVADNIYSRRYATCCFPVDLRAKDPSTTDYQIAKANDYITEEGYRGYGDSENMKNYNTPNRRSHYLKDRKGLNHAILKAGAFHGLDNKGRLNKRNGTNNTLLTKIYGNDFQIPYSSGIWSSVSTDQPGCSELPNGSSRPRYVTENSVEAPFEVDGSGELGFMIFAPCPGP